MVVNVPLTAGSYNAKVPKKKPRAKPHRAEPDWFLPEWIATLKTTQSKLARQCGWNTSTMHGIYHGRTQYYREIVNLIAGNLNIKPYELLMHPDEAFALRQQREVALKIVEGSPPPGRTGTHE